MEFHVFPLNHVAPRYGILPGEMLVSTSSLRALLNLTSKVNGLTTKYCMKGGWQSLLHCLF